MKNILLIAIAGILLTSSIYGENLLGSNFPFEDGSKSEDETQTLLGGDTISFSGFGGMYSSTTIINDQSATFMGGRGAAIIGDVLVIGGGGCGLVYPTDRSAIGSSSNQSATNYIDMGYGGFIIGCNIFQKSIINLSITSLIGGGEFALTDNPDEDYDEGQEISADKFFVAEPMAMMHINITKWMRIGCGVSYRYTRGINTEEFSDEDFSGLSFVAAVDFGWF